MTRAFVYVWKNTKSLRWYLGSHTRKNCHPDNGYTCSSKIVKPLIKQNPEQWQRTILAIGTPSEMLALEAELLEMLDAKHDVRSFNMHNGDGKFTTLGISFVPVNKGKPSPRRGLPNPGVSIALKGKAPHNKGKPSPRKGVPNEKTSIKLKGKKQPTVCRIVDQQEMSISNFLKWCKNEDFPSLKLKKSANMSVAKKGVPMRKVACPHCDKIGGVSRMKQYHFDNCKLLKEEYENN
jgi:hypothetical protein